MSPSVEGIPIQGPSAHIVPEETETYISALKLLHFLHAHMAIVFQPNSLTDWLCRSDKDKKDLVFALKIAIDLDRESDNFTSILIRLLFKADNENWAKLSKVYPELCAVVAAWKNELITPEFTLVNIKEKFGVPG